MIVDIRKFQAVIFDLFHTLTSADVMRLPGKGTSEVLGVRREDWNEQLLVHSDERLRGKVTDSLQIIEKMARAIDPKITDEIIKEAVTNRIERFRHALLNIEDTTLETLAKLKQQGKSLGLISNADVNEIQGWYDSPLSKYFDSVAFSCNVGYVKPEKEIYLRCLKELGVQPEEALYVGDGGSDELKGAKEVGMTTVMTVHVIKHFWPERIVRARQYADFEIDGVRELLSEDN
ncbi:MAG: HAD-IA family hydrolase [candidate division WOR-3 bacterium]|nr:MAG: HAD-IA family hydrolase [candidate division WOR-3 bacterium]